MQYLRNTWYCAGWSDEFCDVPIARTLLEEKLVLWRAASGEICALSDICPHRFAPMHKGVVHPDGLACPYHGLRFGIDGTCIHNPHGEIIPPALRLKHYPVVERHKIAWIWMGDPALLDPATIPDFHSHDSADYVTVGGRIAVKGSYQLVADNLLDLSHTQFLHPILVLPDDPDTHIEYGIVQDGSTITTTYDQCNTKPFGFIGIVWPGAPERLDSLSGVRWQPPSNMLLKIQFVSLDPTNKRELKIWGAELVTPETATTCHYFWSAARNFRRDEEAFSEQLREAISSVFTLEDGIMIADVQENMAGEVDLIALRPVVLPTDRAAIRARMTLRNLIKAETSGLPEEITLPVEQSSAF